MRTNRWWNATGLVDRSKHITCGNLSQKPVLCSIDYHTCAPIMIPGLKVWPCRKRCVPLDAVLSFNGASNNQNWSIASCPEMWTSRVCASHAIPVQYITYVILRFCLVALRESYHRCAQCAEPQKQRSDIYLRYWNQTKSYSLRRRGLEDDMSAWRMQ